MDLHVCSFCGDSFTTKIPYHGKTPLCSNCRQDKAQTLESLTCAHCTLVFTPLIPYHMEKPLCPDCQRLSNHTKNNVISHLVCSDCTIAFETTKPYHGKHPLCPKCRPNKHVTKPNNVVPPLPVNFIQPIQTLSTGIPCDMKELEENFAYPIESFLKRDGVWSFTCDGNISMKKMLDLKQVSTVFYYRLGVRDDEEWILICQLKNGYYMYFRASCDYTGFVCQGGGNIACSSSWNTFVNLLDNTGRLLLLTKQ